MIVSFKDYETVNDKSNLWYLNPFLRSQVDVGYNSTRNAKGEIYYWENSNFCMITLEAR